MSSSPGPGGPPASWGAGRGLPATPAPIPTRRPVLRRVLLWGGVGCLFLACFVLLALFFGVSVGSSEAVLAAVAAALPLAVVVPVLLWVDRLEAEPPRYLAFAFLWGALCAPVGAIVLNTGVGILLARAGARDADSLTAVLSAPPVEEGLKGVAVLAVLLLRRREFDGVVDGIVYAGLAGAGFAFSENILYLGQAYAADGLVGLTAVFVIRCLVAPFAHPLFTAFVGIGLGLAATVARSWWGRLGFAVGGFTVAVLLHGLWNLSATAGYLAEVYLLVQAPVFAGFLLLLVLLRRREHALVRLHLSQYADAGWLSHPEVAMLSSVVTRRAARAWAKANGGSPALASMRAFQDSASDLALLRSRMVTGTAEPAAAEHERALLTALAAHRAAFVGSPIA